MISYTVITPFGALFPFHLLFAMLSSQFISHILSGYGVEFSDGLRNIGKHRGMVSFLLSKCHDDSSYKMESVASACQDLYQKLT